MTNRIETDKLLHYINKNEVVFQEIDGLVEVANNVEKENKEKLLSYFDKASTVEVYTKDDEIIKNDFEELCTWSTPNDVLILLQSIGVLICIPQKSVVENNLIN